MGWFSKKASADITTNLASSASDCVVQISKKWKYFCETLHFKADVQLDMRIEAFSMPILAFVEGNYPELLKGPNPGEFFWTMLFTGILESKTHNPEEVNIAIEVLGRRNRK